MHARALNCVESEKLRNLLPLSGFDDATEDRLIFSTVSTRAEFCSDRLLISKSFSTNFVSARVRRFLKKGPNKLNFRISSHIKDHKLKNGRGASVWGHSNDFF